MNHDPNAFQPVVLVVDQAPLLWQLSDGPLALALFSDAQRAEQYAAAECTQADWRIESPDPTQAIRMLAACVQQDVIVAVLNPHGTTAGRLFDLKAILRRAREQLRSGQPLEF